MMKKVPWKKIIGWVLLVLGIVLLVDSLLWIGLGDRILVNALYLLLAIGAFVGWAKLAIGKK